ncbi:ATP-binding protein, partial [Streptomyces sp. SID11385]|uniref:ATP-binding protein n=1 Tax=Streptomyces sp. SID11385 TaxID=2706031 RepID=UPI0013C89B98
MSGGLVRGGLVVRAAALSYPCAMLGRVQNQSLSPVFVGRDAESGVLAAALGEVSAPEADGPRALVLAGEAGVGKTRL